LTPGFITDFLGLSMLVPPIRVVYIQIAKQIIRNKIETGNWRITMF
jgi:UPF0716 protein FxsA